MVANPNCIRLPKDRPHIEFGAARYACGCRAPFFGTEMPLQDAEVMQTLRTYALKAGALERAYHFRMGHPSCVRAGQWRTASSWASSIDSGFSSSTPP